MEGIGTPAMDDVAARLLGEMDSASEANLEAIPFQSLASLEPGRVAAVDGGQSVLTEIGTCGLVAVRAGFTLRLPGDRYEDRPGAETIRTLTRRQAARDWTELAQAHEWAGSLDPPMLSGPQWLRNWCEAERILLELDAARRALRALRAGDLLLMDGALESDQPQSAAVDSILQAARRDGVHVAAVSKDTTLTLGGTLPFTLEIEEVARRRNAPGRFACNVTPLLEPRPTRPVWAARFDPLAPLYRVDLALADGADAPEILQRLQGLCNDVAYPGYPYPLARVHGNIHYDADETADLRSRLEGAIAERRGSLFSMRLFGRGRDVLALGG